MSFLDSAAPSYPTLIPTFWHKRKNIFCWAVYRCMNSFESYSLLAIITQYYILTDLPKVV